MLVPRAEAGVALFDAVWLVLGTAIFWFAIS
jgi:hypothetical protein